MSGSASRALTRLSERHGILPGYVDAAGSWRSSSPRTLLALLRLLDCPIDRVSEAAEQLAAEESRYDEEFPPVAVALAGRHPRIRFRTRCADPQPRRIVRIRQEGRARPMLLESSVRRCPGMARGSSEAVVPVRLPIGYYDLYLNGERGPRTRLLVAPRRLRPVSRQRSWGIFVPVYALWDQRGLGCGDLTALRRTMRWARAQGARWLGTLPLLSSYLERPYEPSPYRPVSRSYWNEVYLDPSEELGQDPRSRSPEPMGPIIDLRAVHATRRAQFEAGLRRMHAGTARSPGSFGLGRRSLRDVERYARFRARQEMASGSSASENGEEERRRYHRFVQWRTSERLRAIAREGRRWGISLYLDIPIGVHPEGFDAIASEALFVRGAEIGSPPDPGYPAGQGWGVPPPHPERIREDGYADFARTLREHVAVAGAIRIDHVMGLHRLFWIPEGMSAREGGYVRYRSEEQYAVLLIEASRARAAVIGEDFGTVPPEVRRAMTKRGILRSFVAQLEWDGPTRRRTAPIRRDALASLNTHDMAPFATYWAERSVRTDPGDDRHSPWGPRDQGREAALRAVLGRLGRSPAAIVLVGLEDLWGETVPQNVPGTGEGRPNFRRRASLSIEQFQNDPTVCDMLRHLDTARRRSRGSAS